MQIDNLKSRCTGCSPEKILAIALETFPNAWLSFSGSEDVALIDMACRIRENVQVFSIDTGRLHPETLDFIEQVRKRYPIHLEILFPDPGNVEPLVREKGLFSFYQDGHQECCAIRKVAPLKKFLMDKEAWITGQREEQSPATRDDLPVAQLDQGFSGKGRQLVKFNPLAKWTSAQVWDYIHRNGVPYNELHRQGFVSIGCAPCTRAIAPGEHERSGRWWWEDSAKKECGLHLKKPAAPQTLGDEAQTRP
ncbi:MAG: phosphoadenylyl-sulfate reductase [Candidatus Eutrophobiaceae bacterium]